ncbi:zonular occludens toxin family protein [Methylovulum miyakonense]|uniref:zonular occludens toxin family protein n=1 Tax=Methylovulum miyakonense TaxID=645578 RepID=UPI00036ED901|nr:zonular occludens toxin domain-containing protein [Methylovulum miyakonense]
MIICHEGLPRSGKSYEAVVSRILPALKEGRKVFAYIEGLNHQQFADLLDKSLEEMQRLLVFVPKEHVKQIHLHVENDALVIIDELQDFFPMSKQPLDEQQTTFVTQHGHRGLDIIVMTQDHRDCHMLWKRRIDQLITFVKRDAVGQPNAYTWTTYKQRAGKFEKLNSGSGKYDPKYFGLYSSHEPTTLNKGNYADDRANILKSPAFRFYFPAFFVALCFSIYYLYGFFHGAHPVVKVKTKPPIEQPPKDRPPEMAMPANTAATDKPPEKPTATANYLDDILAKYKPRLVGLVENKERTKMVAIIEFLDESNRVYERLTIPQIVGFGYFVVRKPYGLLLMNGQHQYSVTAFPIDRSVNISRHTDIALK